MRPMVYVPFTTIAPGVREALEATGWEWTEVYVGGSDQAYWEQWSMGKSFINVEHDVIVRPDTFDVLAACSRQWCAPLVPYYDGEYPSLACVKFDAALLSAHPYAMRKAGTVCDDRHLEKHYCRLDAWLQRSLDGEPRHSHQPPLGHWRPYPGPLWPSHGCMTDEEKRAITETTWEVV